MPPNAIDLTTVAQVKAWLSGGSSATTNVAPWIADHAYSLGDIIVDPAGHTQKVTTAGTSASTIPTFNDAGSTTADGATLIWKDQGISEDAIIQRVITAASLYWIQDCGLGSQDGAPPTASPLVEQVTFSEVYDGNGGVRMFLRNRPIVSLLSISIGPNSFPQSSSVFAPGVVIDGSRVSISIRGGAPSRYRGGGCGAVFPEGIQNIAVSYVAGYNGTPSDLEQAAIEMIAVNYKRRGWIDQASQSMGVNAGTVSFRSWELPPSVRTVMDRYSRRAIV